MNAYVEPITLRFLGRELLPDLEVHNLDMPSRAMFSAPERILLIGWGKFMRGFVPDFVQLANSSGQYAGRVLAVQRYADQRSDAAARQDTLYTLIARGMQNGRQVEVKRVIGSVNRVLCANRDWRQIAEAVRNRSLRVIVSNATETGLTLDLQDDPVNSTPRSFPGKLTRLLFERWQATGGKDADVAVIPTELVLDNGQLVRRLILEQAEVWNFDREFILWVRKSVHVSNTLVDRIVVGTPRPELLAEECRCLGYRDDLLTCCEPYSLFAIEADDFTQRHFPMTAAAPGVVYVKDLSRFRARKLRLLNGPQMVLTTLGTLLGFRLVYDALKDAQVGSFTHDTVWQEIVPAMGEPSIHSQYATECLQRIANPAIEHRLEGIRVDLTTKNAIRLFPSIRDYMAHCKQLPERLLLTVAATLAVALQVELEDRNAQYIRSRWSSVAPDSPASIGEFTRDAILRLSSSSGEPLDVRGVGPEVCRLFVRIRREGMRSVLSRGSGASPAGGWC